MINRVLVNISSASGCERQWLNKHDEEMCFKDSNYNWAATRQNLSSVCPTKLHSNQFTQLQRLARKIKAVAQLNYQTYLVTYVGSNQQCERSILKL